MIARIARPIAKKVSSSSSRRFSHKPRHPQSNAKGQQGELERLREEVKKRDQRLAELEKQVGEQEKQIGEQEKQIADLERQLALRKQNSTNSTNSSKPPSSDGLAVSLAGAAAESKAGGIRGDSLATGERIVA